MPPSFGNITPLSYGSIAPASFGSTVRRITEASVSHCVKGDRRPQDKTLNTIAGILGGGGEAGGVFFAPVTADERQGAVAGEGAWVRVPRLVRNQSRTLDFYLSDVLVPGTPYRGWAGNAAFRW